MAWTKVSKKISGFVKITSEDGFGFGWFDDPFLDSFFDGIYPAWGISDNQIDEFAKTDILIPDDWFMSEWFIGGWFTGYIDWNRITKTTPNWTKI